jgi:drug/metabolite transporter (DMT)-like permease
MYIYGILFCLFATISWGAMFPIMEIALKVINPFYFIFITYTIESIIFIIILIIYESPKSLKSNGKFLSLWFYGTAGFAGFGFFIFWGQNIIGKSNAAINASVIECTMPIMGVILLWIITKTRPNIITIVSVIIAFIGVIFIIGINHIISFNLNFLGNIFLLLGTFSWIIYTFGIKKFPDWSILRYTALTCAIGVLSMFIIISIATFFGFLHIPNLNNILSIKLEFLYMIFIAGVAGVFAWNIGNRIIGPINADMFINIIPITTVIITLLLGKHINPTVYLGISIIIFAILLNNLYTRKILFINIIKNIYNTYLK